MALNSPPRGASGALTSPIVGASGALNSPTAWADPPLDLGSVPSAMCEDDAPCFGAQPELVQERRVVVYQPFPVPHDRPILVDRPVPVPVQVPVPVDRLVPVPVPVQVPVYIPVQVQVPYYIPVSHFGNIEHISDLLRTCHQTMVPGAHPALPPTSSAPLALPPPPAQDVEEDPQRHLPLAITWHDPAPPPLSLPHRALSRPRRRTASQAQSSEEDLPTPRQLRK